MENQFKEISNEVEKFINESLYENDKSKYLDKYYKGAQILLSSLHNKPKFMFIGINPGSGDVKEKGKNVHKLGLQEKLEYSYKYYNYYLARNTRKLFELANGYEYLENSVKTNQFFFATTKETELYKFLSHFKDDKIYAKSKKWLDRIIEIVEPEIIICEGKSSFDRFIKDKNCEIISKDNVYYSTYNKIHIIGYKRIFSEIINIEKVAEKIKEVINVTL